MGENRPNFELVQVSDDEFFVITSDGLHADRVTKAEAARLRKAIDDPLSVSRGID